MAKLMMGFLLFLAAAGPAIAQSTSRTPPATPPASSGIPTSGAASSQFTTEQAAKAHCPGDTVVWATLSRAKVYHASGDRYYGKTRRGAYMCQQDAVKAGMHQAGRRGAASTGASQGTSGQGTTGTAR
jgi:hypothetical protein